MQVVGKPVNRQDGKAKVTGTARYSADYFPDNVAFGVALQSKISSGTIKKIDATKAEKLAGVLAVLTHENRPLLNSIGDTSSVGMTPGESRLPLDDAKILYGDQYVAFVVAETYEIASHAISLIEIQYNQEPPLVDLEASRKNASKPSTFMEREDAQAIRGDISKGLKESVKKISARYTTPVNHHNPIEPHATVADWENEETLTVYDATQGVRGPQLVLASVFGLEPDNVRVISKYIGGGFGAKGAIWPHVILAALGAKMVKRPVKFVLWRQNMFGTTGHRSSTVQDIEMGTDSNGSINALKHKSLVEGSDLNKFFEACGLSTKLLYQSPNYKMTHETGKLNIAPSIYMRAPGEAPGVYALECAMDEMAYSLQTDPLEFRKKNYAEIDPHSKKPWSSKHLLACYERGAAKIGWSDRKLEPGLNRQGKYLIGYGMATATYPGNRSPAAASVKIFGDGTAIGKSSGSDIGTGAYTVFRQVLADSLGLPIDRVTFDLGDTLFPGAPVAGGSQLTASIAPAIMEAANLALKEIFTLASEDEHSPLHQYAFADVIFKNGRIESKSDAGRADAFVTILQRTNRPFVEGCVASSTMKQSADKAGLLQGRAAACAPVDPNKQSDADQSIYAFQSFGAQFCKLRVDPELGTVRLLDWVSVMDIGRVINPKTARSQVIGGVTFGIGMALMEATLYDPHSALPVTKNLADYHVPTMADIPCFQVEFINEPDEHINRLGSRGVGEIGITGAPAAIANAIFNACGRRIRDLPISPEKLFT